MAQVFDLVSSCFILVKIHFPVFFCVHLWLISSSLVNHSLCIYSCILPFFFVGSFFFVLCLPHFLVLSSRRALVHFLPVSLCCSHSRISQTHIKLMTCWQQVLFFRFTVSAECCDGIWIWCHVTAVFLISHNPNRFSCPVLKTCSPSSLSIPSSNRDSNLALCASSHRDAHKHHKL